MEEAAEPAAPANLQLKLIGMIRLHVVSQFTICSHRHDEARLWLPKEGAAVFASLTSPKVPPNIARNALKEQHSQPSLSQGKPPTFFSFLRYDPTT